MNLTTKEKLIAKENIKAALASKRIIIGDDIAFKALFKMQKIMNSDLPDNQLINLAEV